MKMPAIATSKSVRAQEALDAFSSNYLDYQYQFVEFFVDHLVDMSRVFRGDLQLMLILAILGQVKIRAVRDAMQAGMPAAKARLEAAAKALRDGVAASSKAAVTMAYDRRKFRLEIANRMQVTPIHASMRVMQRGAVRPENSCGEARYLSVGVRRRWPQVTRA